MRPHGKYAVVDTNNPTAFSQCERCGFWRNRTDLVWQVEWAGQRIYSKQILVCKERCYDTPQEQLRTIILPPDPPPLPNVRVPDFAYEENTVRVTQFADPRITAAIQPWGEGPAMMRCDQTGEQVRVLQYITSS